MWKEAWWRKTLRGLLLTDSDQHRQRLDRGHLRSGRRGWDDPMQQHAEEGIGQEEPWQAEATDRARWANPEAGFIQRVLRSHGPATKNERGRWFVAT